MAYRQDFDADEVLILDRTRHGTVQRCVFQVVDSGSLSTSFVPKARVRGLADAKLQSVPYVNRATGATVAAGTAITAEGLFEADVTGVEFCLDNNYTSGAGYVWYTFVDG